MILFQLERVVDSQNLVALLTVKAISGRLNLER